MPVDYSKWDALELSDDSDFEPHPNVDKKSFIRAKQNQIHQQRAERKHRITTLKYERLINDGLLRRIDTLLAELRAREADARSQDPNTFLYQALIASAGDPDDDEAPKPPDGVHAREQNERPLRYSQMMGALVDQVKKEVDDAPSDDWYRGYVKGVEGHKKKVADLQKDLAAELQRLEKEESRKITSDSIHDGFNSSHVNKAAAAPAAAPATATGKGKGKGKGKAAATVEVLNPAALKKDQLADDLAQSSGADADIDEDVSPLATAGDDDDELAEASELGKEFARLPVGDYGACLRFISAHREVLAERETDGLMVAGFDAQMKGKEDYAKQCIHQALLLQYCRSLGHDGVQLFFRRITTPDHQARKLFLDDVNTTYARIRTRVAELAAERAASDAAEGVEQIQLQAVEPGTEIHIQVPPADSADPLTQQVRAIFESFPPNFQKALASGSLDRVNEVLGKMSVDEAEEIVGQLGDSGMLDMRQGVIDGTTAEGQEELRRLHAEKEQAAEQGGAAAGAPVATPDPD